MEVVQQTISIGDSKSAWKDLKVIRTIRSSLVALLGLAVTCVEVGSTEVEKLPVNGDHWLRVLSPNMLELGVVLPVAKDQKDAKVWQSWGKEAPSELFEIVINGTPRRGAVERAGIRRRPRYAPLRGWDLRVESALLLRLSEPLAADAHVEVRLPRSVSPIPNATFSTTFRAAQRSPAIHVSQVGYQTGSPKTARAGYYLGTLGELELTPYRSFYLRNQTTGEIVFRGRTKLGKEVGFTYAAKPCRQVLTLDFTPFDQPGTYALGIEGIGESFPFPISNGYYACLARTYALGLYHQRCGTRVGLPFSRFQHDTCHSTPAKVPDSGDSKIWRLIKNIHDRDHEDQTAPALDRPDRALYPFRRKGEIAVSGGHHDAGDYSKYVINSAQLVHFLTFATDAFDGVAAIDNLGIPESGNGIPDALDTAAYEAAFLARMQDSDGGFYFLVYPRERAYEADVTPDNGDRQTVFPKTTSSTAAASAALCQIASSPSFKRHYPVEADRYLRQATIGWHFLKKARRAHGEIGAYQTISHYGDRFMDRDEIVWLATELFLATGEPEYHDYVLEHFKPGAPETIHWGWLRMQEGYGAAARSYATAIESGAPNARRVGRRPPTELQGGDWHMGTPVDQVYQRVGLWRRLPLRVQTAQSGRLALSDGQCLRSTVRLHRPNRGNIAAHLRNRFKSGF